MGNMYDITHQQFVLNERWLFDATQCRLSDLSGRVKTVTLQPVSARILSLLLQTPHEILRRRQLFNDGWRAFGFEVCDNSLNQVMHTLRTAFESIDPGQPYIRTVPRIGYALLADVRPATAADLHAALSGSPARFVPPPRPAVTPLAEVAIATEVHTEAGIDADWREAQKTGAPLSLLLIDIDQLRSVNDVHGRRLGDDLFSNVERAIQLQLHRTGDRVVRHDGAMLAVRLPDTAQTGAMQVAQRIRAAVEALDWRGRDGVAQAVTVSIGLACTLPASFDTSTAFVGAAAAALQDAKQAGGNQAIANRLGVTG